MDNQEVVLKRDFLVKRSQMKNVMTIENYRSRWFELTPTLLRYSDGTPENGIGNVKGHILLKHVIAVENADAEIVGGRPNAFQVIYKTPGKDDVNALYIIPIHDWQRVEWIDALRRACLEARAVFAANYHPGAWTKKTKKYSCCNQCQKHTEGCTPTESHSYQNAQNNMSPANNVLQGQDTNVERPPPRDPPRNLVPPNDEISVSWQASVPTSNNSSTDSPNKIMVALYSFDGLEPTDLNLIKGEEYVVIDDPEMAGTGWLKVKNKNGEVGNVPANYISVKKSNPLDRFDWYYPGISRTESEAVLKNDGHEGVFLVRDSSQKDTLYTLTLYTKTGGSLDGTVKHYHIKQNEEGKYFLHENHPFASIQDMIYYHQHNCAGLIVRLRNPPGDKNISKPVFQIGHGVLEIDSKLLVVREELGSGQFGKVNRGIYKGRVEVAIKTMKEGTMLEENFIEEARTMMQFQHENLVKLYGVCTTVQPILILTEYLRNGDLLNHMRRHKSRLSKSPDKLLEFCLNICSGMKYLEDHGVIHRDLAARNCLVSEKEFVKVGDFGLARHVLDNEYQSSAGSKFPVKWSAPEVLNYNRFSNKSDIWAYGILMWEVYSVGESPYKNFSNADVVEKVCQLDYRMQMPACGTEVLYCLMLKCWCKLPENRPSFQELHRELISLQVEHQQYVE